MPDVISQDGTRIHYERSGHGPAMVLVSGAFQDHAGMRPYAEALSEQFTVYNYDRRGRGASGDTAPYAIEREVEDIAAVIERAAGGSAFVFGGSSGAVLALNAAAAGLNIPGLILWEPPFVVDDSRPPVPDLLVSELAALLAAGRRSEVATTYLTMGVGMPAETVAGMRADPSWQAGVEPVAHTLLYDATIMHGTMRGKPLPTDRWRAVTMPTLVASGTASFEWAQPSADALATLLPDATRISLAGQSHAVAPDVLAAAITGFVGEPSHA